MKNKKILFLVSAIALAFPFMAFAQSPFIETMFDNITNAFKIVGAAIVIIGFIIAGILWLTSGGSPEKLGGAKKATFAAVVGTALIILATVAKLVITNLLCPGGGC